MKLKLASPRGSMYWTIVGEDLQDPTNWSVFLLNHGPETERYQFEQAVQQVSVERRLVLAPYRLLCRRGMCTLEYDGYADTAAIKAHAQGVADLLAVPLDLSEATVSPRRTG